MANDLKPRSGGERNGFRRPIPYITAMLGDSGGRRPAIPSALYALSPWKERRCTPGLAALGYFGTPASRSCASDSGAKAIMCPHSWHTSTRTSGTTRRVRASSTERSSRWEWTIFLQRPQVTLRWSLNVDGASMGRLSA